MTAKKEPREKLDRTTKHVLLNMIKLRIVPLIQKEAARISEVNKLRRQVYENELAQWNRGAEPAKFREAQRRPSRYIIADGNGGPKLDTKALTEWYLAKVPCPDVVATYGETEEVYFAALYDERMPYGAEVVLHVPSTLAPQIRELADAVDMAVLSGTAAGLVEAINKTVQGLGG